MAVKKKPDTAAEVTMPDPQIGTAKVIHTNPGEEPKLVPLHYEEEQKPAKKLTLEQRVDRIEDALARSLGVDIETI
jgi:hypothetical protein